MPSVDKSGFHGRRCSPACTAAILGLLWVSSTTSPTWATITATGSTTPTNDMFPNPPVGNVATMGNAIIGVTGFGDLSLTGGSELNVTGPFVVGDQTTGAGSVSVRGFSPQPNAPVSKLDLDGGVIIGNVGSALVEVSGGAMIDTTGATLVRFGLDPISSTTINISDRGTSWLHSGTLLPIAANGTAYVTVRAGGLFSASNVALGAGDTGLSSQVSFGFGSVTVTGVGSRWNNFAGGNSGTGELFIGGGIQSIQNGGQGLLRIQASGSVFSNQVSIGENIGSYGAVEIDGSGSIWQANRSLVVGENGTGTILVTQTGRMITSALDLVSTADPVIVANGLTSVGTVEIRGIGSSWTNYTEIFVAEEGQGNVSVTQGGFILSKGVALARTATSRSNVLVDGVGSTWIIQDGPLTISDDDAGLQRGGFAEFRAANGGTVFVEDNDVTVASRGTLTMAGGFIQAGNLVTPRAVINSGIVRGFGRVDANLTNNPTGQVRVGADEVLTFGYAVTNAGLIDVRAGEFEAVGLTTNAVNTGMISGQDAVLRFATSVPGPAVGLTNSGSMLFTPLTADRKVSDVYGDVTNAASGIIVVAGGAQVTFHDDFANNAPAFPAPAQVTVTGNGIFQSPGNSTLILNANVTGGGNITGGGDVIFLGDLRPGNSPATVTYQNSVYFGPSSSLQIELGGTVPCTEYDQVHVIGSLALYGRLDVSLINNFVPAANQSFDILDWQSLTGQFSSITLPTLSPGLMWNSSQLYTSGVLSVMSNSISGDFDNNGLYNCADINLLTNAVATGGAVATFDLNGDNQLTIADVDAWRAVAGNINLGAGRSYRVGDANLDSVVDASDFSLWNAAKFTGNKNWCNGNFNADSVTDASDFSLWNANKFTASDPVMVPEPAFSSIALALIAALMGRRRV